MFIVISDIMAHWEVQLFLQLVSALFRKKMICALMFIISNQYGIKCLSNLQQLEPCNVMFKGISYIMAHLYYL